MATVKIPEGLAGKSLYTFLVQNKSALVAEKKFSTKFADPFHATVIVDKAGQAIKAEPPTVQADGSITRACVINTTNWMDSHSDVHIPGLWDKSLSEQRSTYLLQEHKLTFDGIITDEVTPSVRNMSWMALGYNSAGDTQALIFTSTIHPDRNPKMYAEYVNNRVKNHSVGMQYVRLELAINDEDYKEEYAVWNKYISQVANKEVAEQQGFFWAVKEAKIIEGSAVPIGSNIRTPVLNEQSTQMSPAKATTDAPQETFDVMDAISKINIFNN